LIAFGTSLSRRAGRARRTSNTCKCQTKSPHDARAGRRGLGGCDEGSQKANGSRRNATPPTSDSEGSGTSALKIVRDSPVAERGRRSAAAPSHHPPEEQPK